MEQTSSTQAGVMGNVWGPGQVETFQLSVFMFCQPLQSHQQKYWWVVAQYFVVFFCEIFHFLVCLSIAASSYWKVALYCFALYLRPMLCFHYRKVKLSDCCPSVHSRTVCILTSRECSSPFKQKDVNLYQVTIYKCIGSVVNKWFMTV